MVEKKQKSKIKFYFESAFANVFTENRIQVSDVSPSDEGLHDLQVIATVGITGDMQGNLFIGCNQNAGIDLNKELYAAQGITADPGSLGSLSRSTLGELANQIAGRAAMHLSEIDIDCNITPPTIFSGNALQSELYAAELRFGMIISGSFGDVNLHVEIKNFKKKLNSC